MKKVFVLLVFVIPLISRAQYHLNLFGGISNYQGDLQGKPITIDQSNGAFGASLSYDLVKHIVLRAGLTYGRISADDKHNRASLQARNLNFESKIIEGSVVAEYNLFDLQEKIFTPYVFAGIAVYHFDPYTFDTLGTKYYLKPLSTEGQGVPGYPDRKNYTLTQFAVPFGGGIKLRVSDRMVLGYEIGLRKLFTDYIDDVSTTYVNSAALAAAKGATAVELAYRGGELKSGNPQYPLEGAVRGGAKSKDWYYFQGITLSIPLGGRYLSKQSFGCPEVR